jgi:hypothetical protein
MSEGNQNPSDPNAPQTAQPGNPPANPNPPANSPANPPGAAQPTTSSEHAGVGTQERPKNRPIPDSVKIKRHRATESGLQVESSATVVGDQGKLIMEVNSGRPVHVSIIEGKALTKDTDGRLVYVEGPVANDLMTMSVAKSKFALKKDGTCIYNARGFDDVVGGDFDLIDIEKLVEWNHKHRDRE